MSPQWHHLMGFEECILPCNCISIQDLEHSSIQESFLVPFCHKSSSHIQATTGLLYVTIDQGACSRISLDGIGQ